MTILNKQEFVADMNLNATPKEYARIVPKSIHNKNWAKWLYSNKPNIVNELYSSYLNEWESITTQQALINQIKYYKHNLR